MITVKHNSVTVLTTLMKLMSLYPFDQEVNGEPMHFKYSVTSFLFPPRLCRALANTCIASYISMALRVNLSARKGADSNFILCWTKFMSLIIFSTDGFAGSINRTVVIFVRKLCTMPPRSTVCASYGQKVIKYSFGLQIKHIVNSHQRRYDKTVIVVHQIYFFGLFENG